MHMFMALIGCLGKVYGDAGLLSLLCDSDVYAPATALHTFHGKQYARNVRLRGLKLVMETLFRKLLVPFDFWWKIRDEGSHDLNEKIQKLHIAIDISDIPKVTHIAEKIDQGHSDTLQKSHRTWARSAVAFYLSWRWFFEKNLEVEDAQIETTDHVKFLEQNNIGYICIPLHHICRYIDHQGKSICSPWLGISWWPFSKTNLNLGVSIF